MKIPSKYHFQMWGLVALVIGFYLVIATVVVHFTIKLW